MIINHRAHRGNTEWMDDYSPVTLCVLCGKNKGINMKPVKIVLSVSVLLLCLCFSSQAGYKNVGFQDYYSQLGVDTSFNLQKIEPGQSVEGVVKDVEVLKKAGGPEGVKKGDTVIFHHLGDGKFRLSFPRLENKNSMDIKFK